MTEIEERENKMSLILGIESSCDESAVAVVESGSKVLASAVASQIAAHAVHGGVVPELAAREHLTALPQVLDEALTTAGVTMEDIYGIAVTQGPGLMPALLVGLNFAKALALAAGKPLFGVNHFLAHIYGSFLDGCDDILAKDDTYPALALVVSGGHTNILRIDKNGQVTIMGRTLDDAAGEALDKAAKLLGLGYPGGPVIQRTAEGGDPARFEFPRPLCGAAGKAVAPENRYNFSFSGIKTSLLYTVRNIGEPDAEQVRDLACCFQDAVIDCLIRKTRLAVEASGAKCVIAAGGVACNSILRERLQNCMPEGVKIVLAQRKYCTDNAAMVAGLGYHHWRLNPAGDGMEIDSFARLPELTTAPFLL